MDEEKRRAKHEECIAELHQAYHRYKLGFRGHSRMRQALDYYAWLEHTSARLAQSLGEADERIEALEEERDRYQHAADANHECWQEATRINNSLFGILAAVRVAAMRGDVSEVARLLLVWACWN